MAWSISISTSESQNPGANQSTVSATLYLNWSSWDSYANYDVEGYINIGGNVAGAAAPRAVNYPNGSQSGSVAILSHSVTFTHDANGNRGSVGTSGSFDGDGGYSPGDLSVGGTTYGGINYDRKPGTPPSLTATVNSDKTITVNVGSVSSPAGTPTYYVAYSQNGGAYTGQQGSTGTTFTFSGLTPGQNYGFRAFATNSDGTSGFVYTSSTVFLPSGGKRWDGTSWVPVQMFKRWDGSNWVDISMAKRWNGSAWVDLT